LSFLICTVLRDPAFRFSFSFVARITTLKKETNDDVKGSALDALAKWLALLPEIPQDIVKLYAAGVTSEKDNLRQFHLESLAAALTPKNVRSSSFGDIFLLTCPM
jgi:hypothetical protein